MLKHVQEEEPRRPELLDLWMRFEGRSYKAGNSPQQLVQLELLCSAIVATIPAALCQRIQHGLTLRLMGGSSPNPAETLLPTALCLPEVWRLSYLLQLPYPLVPENTKMWNALKFRESKKRGGAHMSAALAPEMPLCLSFATLTLPMNPQQASLI